jgi:nucleoside-diphosphate-sugar epimerase
MKAIEKRYQELLEPSDRLISEIAELDGDILILGVGGKMGPALARLARQAIDKTSVKKKVIGVARFSEPGLQEQLKADGIETVRADLLEDDQLQTLPAVKNVLYLAGTKFGTTGKESFTWAMNAYLPGRVAQQFRESRIVVFSTGNVYPLTPVKMGGADESFQPQPVGEYAQSCLGRERLFQYYSSKNNTLSLFTALIMRMTFLMVCCWK